MDVCGIFLGDSNMTYGSMRSALYRDYEQFPYGTLENTKTSPFKDSYSKVKEKCEMVKTQKNGKQKCPFCKEHKKRPLVSYLRRRDMQKNEEKICEEKEEEEEEEEEEISEENKCTDKNEHQYFHEQFDHKETQTNMIKDNKCNKTKN